MIVRERASSCPQAFSRAFAWRERLKTYRSEAEQAQRRMTLDFLARLEHEHSDWFEAIHD